jgi:hypothetical protein
MANVAIGGRDDDVLFYNPAQLVVARGTSFSLARTSAHASGGTISTVLRLGSVGVGLGVNYLEYRYSSPGGPRYRTDLLGSSGQLGSSMDAVLGLATSYHGFRIGASSSYGVDRTSATRLHSAVADIGLSRDVGRGVTAGFALQHIGGFNADGGERPPTEATIGVAGSGPVGPLDVTLTTAVSAMRRGNLSPAAGAEVGWSWLSGYTIAARGGVRYPRRPGEASATGGFGFTADRVSIDLSGELIDNKHISYRAGVRVR